MSKPTTAARLSALEDIVAALADSLTRVELSLAAAPTVEPSEPLDETAADHAVWAALEELVELHRFSPVSASVRSMLDQMGSALERRRRDR